jgi:hypothetical protein
MQTPNLDQEATRPGRSRRMVMLGAGALALALAIIGTVAAVADRSSSATQAHDPAVLAASPATIAAAPQSPSNHVASKPAKKAKETPAGPLLADGIYPTYVTKVDVDGATITVDVLQVFQDQAAVDAAIEDGMTAEQVQGMYIYVRNQNPLLRTLPVAGDVRIEFLGTCESPGDRDAALTELAKKTKHFDSLYYYDITVTGGAIHQIIQRIATAACRSGGPHGVGPTSGPLLRKPASESSRAGGLPDDR